MSYTLTPKDFLIEVNKGNVPGHSTVFVGGSTDGITTDEYRDISPIATPETDTPFATTSETLEIVSSDAGDTSAGAGARTAVLFSMADDYTFQAPTFVTLNGITPVVLGGTHFRVTGAIIVTAGSNSTNIGDLTIRVSGGGTVRALIKERIGTAQTGTFTVAAGTVAFLQNLVMSTPKNNDIDFRTRIRNSVVADAAELSGGDIPVYQSSFLFPVIAPVPLTVGFDFRGQAISNNVDTRVTYQGNFLVVDTDLIGAASSMEELMSTEMYRGKVLP